MNKTILCFATSTLVIACLLAIAPRPLSAGGLPCSEVWTDMRPLSIEIVGKAGAKGFSITGLEMANEAGRGQEACLSSKNGKALEIWTRDWSVVKPGSSLRVAKGATVSTGVVRALSLDLGEGDRLLLRKGPVVWKPEPKGGVVFEVETTYR